MSILDVNQSVMDNANEKLRDAARKISGLREQMESVLQQLNMRSAGFSVIRSRLQSSIAAAASQEEKVRCLSAALAQIIAEYARTEKQLAGGTDGSDAGRKIGDIWRQIDSVRSALGMDPAALFSDDPVNLSNGNYVYEKSFFEYDTVLPFSFRMFYNVCGEQGGALGSGWLHSFERKLAFDGADFRVISEDASAQRFREEQGQFYPAPGTFGSLQRTGEGYLYTDDENDSWHFDPEGRIIGAQNPNGWRLDFFYEGGLLRSVSCTDGVSIFFSYDEEDRLASVGDSAGRQAYFRYAEGRLCQVCDPNGHVTQYFYDEKGRMNRILSPSGELSVENSYDDAGRTLRQEFADGGVVTYAYDDAAQSVRMRRQNGSEVVYYHDALFRSTRTVYPNGEEVLAYNDNNQKTSFTDRLGRNSRYEYDENGRLLSFRNPAGSLLAFSYTSAGQVNQISLDGQILGTAEYDSFGHQLRHVNANGDAVSFAYDELGRVTRIRHEDGSMTELSYDEFGNIRDVTDPITGKTSYRYDKAKRVICSTDALGSETHYEYDAADQLIRVTDANGKSRSYEYDARDNLTKIVDFNGGVLTMRYNAMNKLAAITDADGNTTSFEYDQMSNPIRKTAADGGVTEYSYDSEGHMTAIRHPMGGVETAEYDAVGNMTKRCAPDGGEYLFEYDALNHPVALTDPTHKTRRAVYDKLGNVTEIHYEDGTAEYFTFDLEGRRLSHTDQLGYQRFFKYNALGKITEISDAQGVLTAYTYGPGGQLRSETNADGSSLSYSYDAVGNVLEVADSVRGVWRFRYDALHRVIRAEQAGGRTEQYEYDPLGNICAIIDGEGNRTAYEYSKAGALLRVVDALGNETAYRYDPCYRLREILQPESGHFDASSLNAFNREQQIRTTSYQWDLDGNMISSEDCEGARLEFGYDSCGRVISRKDQDGYTLTCAYRPDGTEESLLFGDGRKIAYEFDALKRLSRIEDWLGITRIERDAVGRVVDVTEYDGARTSYQWNGRGACTSLSYPDGRTAQYGYDAAGRLVSSSLDQTQVSYDYFSNGLLRSRSDSRNLRTDYAYDAAGRILSLTHSRDGEELSRFRYAYDSCGRKTHITEAFRGEPEEEYRFGYDPRGSLLSVTRNGVLDQSFVYDAFGNRSRMLADGRETSYGYDALNRLQWKTCGQESHVYSYDRRGNLTGETVNGVQRLTLHFDALNRLTAASSERGTAEYRYNGLGALASVRRVMGGQQAETRYLYDFAGESGHCLAAAHGGAWEDYFWDGQVIEGGAQDAHSLLLADERLSGRLAISGQGAQRFRYDAFGCLGSPAPADGFAFAGFRNDPVTGLYDAGWRQYDAQNGRFISQDPVAGGLMTPLTLNPYLYCLSDPINRVDPTGMIVAWLAGGIVGAVVNVGMKFAGDVVNSVASGKWTGSSWESYVGAAAGGFVEGSVFVVAGPTAAGAAGAATETLVTNGLSMIAGEKGYRKEDGYTVGKLLGDTAISGAKGAAAGFAWGAAAKYLKIPGITSGRGNMSAVWKQVMTKAQRGIIQNVTMKTLGKGLLSFGLVKTMDAIIDKGISKAKDEAKKFFTEKGKELIEKLTQGGKTALPASMSALVSSRNSARCATA